MESRAYALITGLFVLGLAGCIVLWAHWLAKTPIARTVYRVVATGPVSGLNPEAQVRYRGMGVGRVSAIGLDQKDPRRILVNIEVDESIPITRGTYAQLGMEGITGIAYVHLLDDYKDMQAAAKAADGVAELPLRPAFFDTLSDNAEGAIKDARELHGEHERHVDAGKPQAHRDHARVAGAHLGQPRDGLGAHAGHHRARRSVAVRGKPRLATSSLEHINETVKALPDLTRETQLLVKDARSLAGEVSRLSNDAGSATGTVRDDTLPRVNALAESVERSSQRVGRLALQLDREPQSAIFGRKPGRPGPGEPGFQ